MVRKLEPRPMVLAVLCAAGVALSAWMLFDGVADLRALPTQPTRMTLAALAERGAPRWIELEGALPLCDREHEVGQNGVVPVVDVDEVDAPAQAMLLSLDSDELCPALVPPLRVAPLGRSAWAGRVLDETRGRDRPPVVADDVFELEPDPIGDARINVAAWSALCLAALAALGWLTRKILRHRQRPLQAAGLAGAAPVDGVLDALAHGASAQPQESVLPAAPLVLSSRAESMAWRRRYLGPSILVLCSVALTALCAWGTVGIVDDLRAWHDGVTVQAQLKGRITSKLIVSILDVNLVYQMPDEERPRTQGRWFMTLWLADEDAGRVRALRDDPTVVTFEEAVDLVPFRIPTVLLGFALAGGCLLSARNSRKRARVPSLVAQSAREGALREAHVTEMRTNGAVTGYHLTGVLEGRAVSLDLGPQENPARIAVADASGALLVAVSGDGQHFVPVFADGEPFLWSKHDLVQAQAILAARGSPTRLTVQEP